MLRLSDNVEISGKMVTTKETAGILEGILLTNDIQEYLSNRQ